MGNTPALPFPEEDVTNMAVRVVETFGPRYFKAFQLAYLQTLLEQKRREARAARAQRRRSRPTGGGDGRPATAHATGVGGRGHDGGGGTDTESDGGMESDDDGRDEPYSAPLAGERDGGRLDADSEGSSEAGVGFGASASNASLRDALSPSSSRSGLSPAAAASFSVGALTYPKPVDVPLQVRASKSTSIRRFLSRAPTDPEPLMQGWLQKRGEVHKTWRRRWFVVSSEDNNCEINYFAKKEQADDLDYRKGFIHLCGYRAKRVKATEAVKTYGEFAIVLTSRDPRRRDWYVRCAGEDDRRRWKEVFKFAAQNSVAPRASDPVMRKAFEDAYMHTRAEFSLETFLGFTHREEDELVALAMETIEKGGVVTYYKDRLLNSGTGTGGGSGVDGDGATKASLVRGGSTVATDLRGGGGGGGGGGSGARKRATSLSSGAAKAPLTLAEYAESEAAQRDRDLEEAVENAVRDVVSVHWRKYVTALVSTRRQSEAQLSEHISETLRAQKDVMAHIRKPITRELYVLLQDMAAPVLVPLCGAFVPTVFDAFEEVLRAFGGRFQAACAPSSRRKGAAKRPGMTSDDLMRFAREARWFSGPLFHAYKRVRDLTRAEVDAVSIEPALTAVARAVEAEAEARRVAESGEAGTGGGGDGGGDGAAAWAMPASSFGGASSLTSSSVGAASSLGGTPALGSGGGGGVAGAGGSRRGVARGGGVAAIDSSPVPASILAQADAIGVSYPDRTVPIGEFLDMMQGMTLYEVELKVEASLLRLVRDAAHSLSLALEARKKREAASVGLALPAQDTPLNDVQVVVSHMAHDAILAGVSDVRSILFDVLMPPFKAHAVDLVEPLMDDTMRMVPGHVASFLDMEGLRDRVLRDMVYQAVDEVCDVVCRPFVARLRALTAAIGSTAGARADGE